MFQQSLKANVRIEQNFIALRRLFENVGVYIHLYCITDFKVVTGELVKDLRVQLNFEVKFLIKLPEVSYFERGIFRFVVT